MEPFDYANAIEEQYGRVEFGGLVAWEIRTLAEEDASLSLDDILALTYLRLVGTHADHWDYSTPEMSDRFDQQLALVCLVSS